MRGLLLDGAVDWAPGAETLLHFASRAEHVAVSIRPALEAGIWVVCDRFADSTMAYQGWGQGADRGQISALTGMLGVTPDLSLVLDVPVSTSLARLQDRGYAADRYERLGAGFFARVRHGFRAIAEAEPGRCLLLDGEADVPVVAGVIMRAVAGRFTLPVVTC